MSSRDRTPLWSSSGRRTTLVVALLVLFVTSVALWWSMGQVRQTQASAARAEFGQRMVPYAGALSNSLNSRLSLNTALHDFAVARLEDGVPHATFDTFASGMYARNTGIRAIELAPGGVIEYVYPIPGNEAAVGLDLLNDPRTNVVEDARRAFASGGVVVGGPYDLAQGGQGIVVRELILNLDGTPWGLTTIVVDIPAILSESGLDPGPTDVDFALRDANGTVFWGGSDVFDRSPVVSSIALPEGEWVLAAAPAGGWEALARGDGWVFWAGGGVICLVLSVLAYQMASQQQRLRLEVAVRTRELAIANAELVEKVNELQTADENVRLASERFEQLFHRAPVPLVMAVDGHLTDANDSFAALLGVDDPEDLVGLSVIKVVAESERAAMAGRVADRAAGRPAPTSYETIGLTRDGKEFPVRMDVITMQIREQTTTVAAVTDLRERRATEASLLQAEADYRVLFEQSPAALFVEDFSAAKAYLSELPISPDGLANYLRAHPEHVRGGAQRMVVVRANEAVVALTGAPNAEALLGPLDSYVIDENLDLFCAELRAIAEGVTRFSGESLIPLPGGELRRLAIDWRVPPGYEETFERVYVSVTDVTEERAAREELVSRKITLESQVNDRTAALVQANAELQEATRAKSEFLAAMSHELRTPLNSVIGFSGTILQGLAGDINTEQRKQLEMIQRAGRHLLGLINQVLDLAKIEAGRAEVTSTTIRLEPFVRNTLEGVTPLAHEKGLGLALEFENVPQAIQTDADRLRQILLNLLSNAVKFTEIGRVALDVRGVDGSVEFLVCDTGPGVPESERGRVFDAFHQVRSVDGYKPDGTGLGLSISRDLAVLLGGSLEMFERPGWGGCFRLTIPVTVHERASE